MNDIANKELIERALAQDPDDVPFQDILDESASPLSQPVIEKKDITDQATQENTQENKDVISEQEDTIPEGLIDPEPTDAPEQEFTEDPEEEITDNLSEPSDELKIPLSHAKASVEAILGSANQIIGVGAGYFVTIKKHEEFYSFDELIELVEEQNEKNITRIKLDEEDKAMLSPILIRILRKKGKALTDEQQLLMVTITIIIKKAKVVMEIRAENIILEQRFLDIIKQQNTPSTNDQASEKFQSPESEVEITEETEINDDSLIPPSVMEVSDDEALKEKTV